jgi:hypothetical protein
MSVALKKVDLIRSGQLPFASIHVEEGGVGFAVVKAESCDGDLFEARKNGNLEDSLVIPCDLGSFSLSIKYHAPVNVSGNIVIVQGFDDETVERLNSLRDRQMSQLRDETACTLYDIQEGDQEILWRFIIPGTKASTTERNDSTASPEIAMQDDFLLNKELPAINPSTSALDISSAQDLSNDGYFFKYHVVLGFITSGTKDIQVLWNYSFWAYTLDLIKCVTTSNFVKKDQLSFSVLGSSRDTNHECISSGENTVQHSSHKVLDQKNFSAEDVKEPTDNDIPPPVPEKEYSLAFITGSMGSPGITPTAHEKRQDLQNAPSEASILSHTSTSSQVSDINSKTFPMIRPKLATRPSLNMNDLKSSGSPNSPPSSTSLLDVPEDSPLFRATVADLEKKTSSLRTNVKYLVKVSDDLASAYETLFEAEEKFTQAITSLSSLQSASEIYFRPAHEAIKRSQENYVQQFQNLFLTPLKMLLENDLNSYDEQKKEFDHASEAYYSHLAKYLSTKKNRSLDEKKLMKMHEKDAKFARKKSTFDLNRYNYYVFMQQLHSRKVAEMKNYIVVNYEKLFKMYDDVASKLEKLQPNLSNVDYDVKTDGEKASLEHKANEELRKQLETVVAKAESTEKKVKQTSEGKRSRSGTSSNWNLGQPLSSFDVSTEQSGQKFRGIRDLDPSFGGSDASIALNKEGFLFANTNGAHWVRSWCVLSAGKLREYSDLKRLDNFFSVDLRVCTVREVRETGSSHGNGSRRFCFEVVSPYLVRTYQAISEEDTRSWVRSIGFAIEQILNENSPRRSSTGLDGSEQIQKILSFEGNNICADCSSKEPVWCSLNLGIVLCKDCSGVHRSLGSHLSKVRSLLLDNSCYTPEILTCFEKLTNIKVNSILEARLDHPKPEASAQRQEKLSFIQLKYSKLAFLEDRPCNQKDMEFSASIGNERLVFSQEEGEALVKDYISSENLLGLLQFWTYLLKKHAEEHLPFPALIQASTNWLQSIDVIPAISKKFLELQGLSLK